MASLIDRVKRGEPQAVSDFYKQYSGKINNYLVKHLPTSEDAQELTNDVFLESIDSMHMLSKDDNLQAWLFRIAHNKMVDYYRKRKIKSMLLSQIPYLEIIANEISQPEFQYEKDRIRDKIEQAILKLSPNHQKILRLHYEENMPVKDIAPIFNLSFKATESLLYRARKQFQIAYGSH
jgi:RNA polymerase sigma-70 factor, ECF subfamily